MSGTDYTQTPNLGLYMPVYDMDDGNWGFHLNDNAQTLDSAIHALQGTTAGGPFLPLSGGTVTGPLNYTATGGTTARSAQDRAFLCVEDFGAKGDGTTDDSAAFNAYANYIRATAGYQPQRTLILSANRSYYIAHPLDFNRFQGYRVTVQGNGSIIIGNVTSGQAIISAMASDIAFKDLRIVSQTARYGIQIGMPTSNGVDDLPCHMDNVQILGNYGNAALYNRCAEVSTFVGCKFQTELSGGYAVIMDGCVHWQIDQTTITDTLYIPGTPQDTSFNEQAFLNCIMINHSAASPGSSVWMGGCVNRHTYINCYAQVASGSSVVVYYATSATGAINSLTWDVHSEVAPPNLLFITGPYATPVIGELEISDHYNQIAVGGSVFALDTTITSCVLRNFRYRVPGQQNAGVVLFDQPAKYTVTGHVAVPTRAVFNGAKFSGTMSDGAALLNYSMTAMAAQGLSANGQTIAVPPGYDGAEISNGTGNLTGLIMAPGTSGRKFTLLNASGFSLTFAAQATSNVLAGGPVIATYTAKTFLWDTTLNLWWPT